MLFPALLASAMSDRPTVKYILPFPALFFSQKDIGCTATLNPSPCAGFSEDFRFNT
jgi:hypothetical protein